MNILAAALAPAPILAEKIEVQRVRTIRLYGKLGAQFGRVHHLAVANPAEAVQALIHLHPGFEKFLMEAKDHGMGFSVFVGTRNLGEKSLRHPCGNEDIRIAPVLLSSKNGGWLQVILGVVLIIVGVVITGLSYGWAAPVGSALIGMGISMIVGGVIQLLSPQPKLKKPSERADSNPSYNFAGPVNTSAQGHPVPLLYGELIVGSAVASAGINIKDNGYTPLATVPKGGGRGWVMDTTINIVGASGGSGQKQQRSPIEAPDSLQSTAYMRLLDVVSEGPIEGLVNGLRSVYFNETPLQNADGSFNFQRVSIDWRYGTQDQDSIAGFDSVENEIGVNVELKQATPWSQAITNKDLDAIAIRISTPTLETTNTSNGDTNGGTVQYQIELSTDGGAFVTVVPDTITGKTTSKYERQNRIDLPRAVSGWVIRVTRLTPDSSSATIVNPTVIESYTEIVDGKFSYPNTAHFGTLIDAQQFQSAPSRAFHLKGRNTIKVPSNYDPVNRTYSGDWDGTFKPAYTNNPAWVFYDLILHKRYGLGRKVTESQINKWALYVISQYCDQLVPNGLGGMEPRMTCNVFLQTKEDAYKVLQDLAGAFASMVYWAGGMVHAVCDMPSDPVYQYTPANVLDGKFEYSGTAKQARHTAALVTWNNPANFYKPEPVYVEDGAGIARYGLNLVEVQAIGCTTIGQAQRYGRRLLATERMQTDVVSFGVGLDGSPAVPGQVVKIADPLRLGQRLGGRITSATANSITVDKMPDTLPVAGDTLNVVGRDGSLISGAIQSIDAATKTIVMAAAFASLPIPQSIWSVERSNLSAGQYRILTVTRPKSAQYAITAIRHDDGKYPYIDADVPIVGKKTVDISLPNQVTEITLAKFDRTTEYTTETVIAADWKAPTDAVAYDVSWKKDDGNWSAPLRQRESHSEYANAKPGSYAVRVASVNAAGFTGTAFTSSSFVLSDTQPAPPAITDIRNDAALQAARVSQEIVDRQADVIAMGAAAADDATAKANAALATAQAQADAIQAQLNDFTGQADDWNNTTAYPKGDFVKDSGKLYRAIDDVPAGTAVTNTAHWEQLGNYSSAGDVIAAAISMSTANTTDIAAEASTRAALSTKLTGLADPSSATLPTLTSGLLFDERQSRSTADASEVTARQGLSAKLTGFNDPTGKTLSDLTSGLVYEEKTARAAADGAAVSRMDTMDATIAGKASSAAMDLLKLQTINAQPNLIQNPTFANDLVGWGFAKNAGPAAMSRQTWSYGTGAVISATGAGNYATTYTDVIEGCVPGAVYTLSAQMVRDNTVGNVYIRVYALNTGGAVVGTIWSYLIPAGTTGDFNTRISVSTGAIDASAVRLRVELVCENTTANTYLRRVKLEQGSTNTSYDAAGQIQSDGLRLRTLESSVNDPTTGLVNTRARIVTEETTRASADSAAASRMDTMQADINGRASASVVNSIMVYAGSGNLLANTAFSTDINGWGVIWNEDGSAYNYTRSNGTLSGDPNQYAPAKQFSIMLNKAGLTPVAGKRIQIAALQPVNVAGLPRICFAINYNTFRTTMDVAINWYDKNWNSVGTTWSTSAHYPATGNGAVDQTNQALAYAIGDRPAGAEYATGVVMLTATGEVSPYVWLWSPRLMGVPAGSNVVPQYEIGGGETRAQATLMTDVNGRITGYNISNNGATGIFDIVSDKFRITSPTGGARTEFSDGNWRTYDSAGQIRVQLGVW